MKDNLFELLLSLFEKTLTQLKEQKSDLVATENVEALDTPLSEVKKVSVEVQLIKEPGLGATRVFTMDEQMKFTKASHQFLVRLSALGIISSQTLELIINKLFFSESRFVSLQETKWTIRNVLAQTLTVEQLSFLDLVLYCQEDEVSLH